MPPNANHPEAVRYPDPRRRPRFWTVAEVRAADKRKHDLMKPIGRNEW